MNTEEQKRETEQEEASSSTTKLPHSRAYWVDAAQICTGAVSLITGVAAIAALVFSILSYQNSLKQQSILAAYGYYVEYLKISLEKKETFRRDERDLGRSFVLTTAEVIYQQTRPSEEWERSVRAMLAENRALFERAEIECAAFKKDFLRLLVEETGVPCPTK